MLYLRSDILDHLAFQSTDPLAADGQPSKRRGPKPDSKPALTRRQELNRQAQRYVLNWIWLSARCFQIISLMQISRTHRERKELYIKALEQEVLRLKETYGNICRERDTFADDNQKLRELLAANGIACPDGPTRTSGPGSTGSISAEANIGSSHYHLTPQSNSTSNGPNTASLSPQSRNGLTLPSSIVGLRPNRHKFCPSV